MDIFGESALEREGALAAAHGQSWQSNPFLHKHNMPQAAGESLGDWSRRHDAWQRGFEGYFQLDPGFAHRRKDRRSAEMLKTLVEHRLQGIPAMQSITANHPRFTLRLPLPLATRHDRKQRGRDWELEDIERSTMGPLQIDMEPRSIVKRLRRQLDILLSAMRAGVSSSKNSYPSDSGDREPRIFVTSEPVGKEPLPTEARAAPMPLPPCSTAQESSTATDMAVQTASPLDEQRLKTELGIRRMGWRYEYRGYRYDRLADAAAYARVDRERQHDQAALEASPQADKAPPMPSLDDLALMAAWEIRFDAGFYSFQQYRYEHLCDAVAYARVLASRWAVSDSLEHRS
jgi:hypothetical protein